MDFFTSKFFLHNVSNSIPHPLPFSFFAPPVPLSRSVYGGRGEGERTSPPVTAIVGTPLLSPPVLPVGVKTGAAASDDGDKGEGCCGTRLRPPNERTNGHRLSPDIP